MNLLAPVEQDFDGKGSGAGAAKAAAAKSANRAKDCITLPFLLVNPFYPERSEER